MTQPRVVSLAIEGVQLAKMGVLSAFEDILMKMHIKTPKSTITGVLPHIYLIYIYFTTIVLLD